MKCVAAGFDILSNHAFIEPDEPKGSASSSADVCECGHPRVNHSWYAPRGEACIGNRNLCSCRLFRLAEPEPRCEGCGHTEGEGCGCPPQCTCGCPRSSHMGKPQGCIPHGFHEYEVAPEPPMTPEEEEEAPPDEGLCEISHATIEEEEACEQKRLAAKTPPQPVRRPPYAIAYSVQGHLYEVALPGDAAVRAVDGALVITHTLGPVAGIVQAAPYGSEERS